MLTYDKLSGNARDFLAMTGSTVEEFQAILEYFRMAFLSWVATTTLTGTLRTGKAYSTYSTCPFPSWEDKLLFILVYMKQYPTQTLLGLLFGVSQSLANIWIHRLEPLVNTALADARELPARDAAEVSFETDTEFFIMARNSRFCVQRIPNSRKRVIAERKSGIPRSTTCSVMPGRTSSFSRNPGREVGMRNGLLMKKAIQSRKGIRSIGIQGLRAFPYLEFTSYSL